MTSVDISQGIHRRLLNSFWNQSFFIFAPLTGDSAIAAAAVGSAEQEDSSIDEPGTAADGTEDEDEGFGRDALLGGLNDATEENSMLSRKMMYTVCAR